MRQSGLKVLSLLVLVTILSSCNLDSLKDPVVVAEVNNEFEIGLWEELAPFGKNFYFNINTIEEYDCENYSIDYNLIKKFREFNISLADIQEPGDCQEGTNFATASLDLGTLSNGFYELNIDLKNTVINQGQLTVSSDSYLIEMEDAKGISFLQHELLRVPDFTLWGHVSYGEAMEQAADDFIAQLDSISHSKVLKKGYYGYFSVEEENSNKIVLPDAPTGDAYKTFLFHYEGQDTPLSELVEQFRNEYGDSIQIELMNDQGKTF